MIQYDTVAGMLCHLSHPDPGWLPKLELPLVNGCGGFPWAGGPVQWTGALWHLEDIAYCCPPPELPLLIAACPSLNPRV